MVEKLRSSDVVAAEEDSLIENQIRRKFTIRRMDVLNTCLPFPPLFTTGWPRLASTASQGRLWFSRCCSDMFSLVWDWSIHVMAQPPVSSCWQFISTMSVFRTGWQWQICVSSRVNVDCVVNDAFWCRGVENVDFETIFSILWKIFATLWKIFSILWKRR